MNIQTNTLKVADVDPDRLDLLVETYREHYADKLGEPRRNTGKGREGLPDGWINGLGLYRITNPIHENLHWQFLEEISKVSNQPIAQVMFNRLEPNGKLDEHIDGPPYRDRYHLVLTGSYIYTQDDTGYMFEAGYWYGPILYWKPHAVHNGPKERVTMLVDFE